MLTTADPVANRAGDRWAVSPAGPPVQLVHETCGQVAEAVPTCSRCGTTLHMGDVRAIAGPGAADSRTLPSRTSLIAADIMGCPLPAARCPMSVAGFVRQRRGRV
ncbi:MULTISPECIES: hypothetical protein [Protofrankia]|uniref:hypothetical protein n=1 Tax=Protofrankia TaxID=2994361 RepID=UPI0001C5338A|nr:MULTISPECIES: hypothetical protein [Protofrankia]